MERVQCNCAKCAACCKGNPGWFLPGEAEKAAEELGMTFRYFFKRYLIVEYWIGDNGDILVLAPRRVNQDNLRAGWNDNFMRGDCRFLSSTGCTLSTGVRPIECAAVRMCGKTGNEFRYDIMLAWNTPELQTWLKGLPSE